LQVNVSAAVEIVSHLELWEKFEGERKVSIAEMAELTKADEIIISKYPLFSPSSVY
jgi:hypothetical protein